MVQVALRGHRSLQIVVQILATLVDVRIHESTRSSVAFMGFLVQVVVLVLHDERRIVARSSLDYLAERLLQAAADLDVPHSGRSVVARLLDLVSLLCIVGTADGSVRPHALLEHVVLSVRGVVGVRSVALPVCCVHLLEALHVSGEFRGVHHRDIHVVSTGAGRTLS